MFWKTGREHRVPLGPRPWAGGAASLPPTCWPCPWRPWRHVLGCPARWALCSLIHTSNSLGTRLNCSMYQGKRCLATHQVLTLLSVSPPRLIRCGGASMSSPAWTEQNDLTLWLQGTADCPAEEAWLTLPGRQGITVFQTQRPPRFSLSYFSNQFLPRK